MKNPYNPETEPASWKWFNEKPVEEVKVKKNSTIRDEMNEDMLDGCMPVGEIESCLNHWFNKYTITYK